MNSRIKKMREYKNRIAEAERIIKEEKDAEIEKLKSQIRKLQPRIETLLETANEAILCGIELYRSSSSKEFNFISDGITHKVGLYPGSRAICEYRSIKDFKFMGIINGGACGSVNFMTDGNVIVGSADKSNSIVDPRVEDMEKFLREFDTFEQDFYSYIDKLIL